MTPENPDTQAIDAGWIKTAKVGDKVACVQDGRDLPCVPFGDVVPIKGEVYTIREIEIDTHDGEAYLLFEELRNPPAYCLDGFGEVCFHHEGFRPVTPRKTDISFAHDILRKATKPVKERV